VLPGVVRYTFIIFGLSTKPNLVPPLTQNSGDATGYTCALDMLWSRCCFMSDNISIVTSVVLVVNLPSLSLTTEGWIHLGGGPPNLSSAR